ncbi:hypothetical protein LMJ53_08120 [Rheinheimera sp. UJ51]|uniref:hypothetical protein n=1 Tax=Rheinheimera sp. UJ51 TaxID=2892446 RepID=UPI001E2A5428|nr:hypothetical protein [Rheinheimera sp. UJ51]MCC5451690.1 hypothetical protein [Rheinheimera sp. UJ51]
MKINEPITSEQHLAADHAHAETVKKQRAYIHSIAEKMETGKKLSSLESKWAAAVLRAAATRMSEVRPRNIGKPSILPGDLAIHFNLKVVFDGLSRNKAIENLAEQFNVSETAIKKHLGLIGKDNESKKRKIETDEIYQSMLNSSDPPA